MKKDILNTTNKFSYFQTKKLSYLQINHLLSMSYKFYKDSNIQNFIIHFT